MKTNAIFFFLLIHSILKAQISYEEFFTSERLRYDYGIMGTADTTKMIDYNFYRESSWGGSLLNLIDTMRYGDFMLEVHDSVSDRLLYSRGYSTLFNEWKTIDEAITKERLFLESIVMPFPKNTIKISLLERDYNVQFTPIHSTYLNPVNKLIETKSSPINVDIKKMINNGPPASKVDIVILSEGYTAEQKYKFFNDAERFKSVFFRWKPYDELSRHINIYAVFSESDETGTDIPTDSLWVSTTLNSHFNTFNTERYLTTEDIYRVRDLLADVPYDQICILVNTNQYGGGGIYNYFTLFTSDHKDSEFLFQHEFGHAFAALADEYFTSEVAYNEMFNLEKEPYQPNITTLIDFGSKWKNMVPDTVPVPTPNIQRYSGVVGVFEGAGYSAVGIYRPYYNCSMKSVTPNAFCPVCRKAIKQMILFYSE
jgi:hypothetical protein